MDWSQISIGAIGGAVGSRVLAMLGSVFDHFLEQRKIKANDTRDRAKLQEEQDKKAADVLEKDRAYLLLLQTKMEGTSDLMTAADLVGSIHSFFVSRPHYINVAINRDFLVKYPNDYRMKRLMSLKKRRWRSRVLSAMSECCGEANLMTEDLSSIHEKGGLRLR